MPGQDYLTDAARPLPSLVFVAPMVLVHELGRGGGVLAGGDVGRALVTAGVAPPVAAWLLPLVVVAILLTWHLAAKDRWRVRAATLLGMAAESAALAVPLLALAMLTARLPLAAGDASQALALAFGAGVYEELLFRLVGVTLGVMLLGDVLRLPQASAATLAVLGSALAFALHHYRGPEPFAWDSLAFRTAAGAFLGAVFLTRGFGVAAGTHAAYDALVLLGRP